MFVTKEKIRFHDSDPAGILFYGNVFRIIHAAFEDMIESFNLSFDYFNDEDIAFPLVHAESAFVKPIEIGTEVKITIGLINIADSTFNVEYKIYNKVSELLAKVSTTHVCVDKESFEKYKLPKDLRHALELLSTD